MQEVADVLRQERHALELLLYRLTVARALLSAEDAQFLTWSSREVERARQRVREIDLLRAANVQLLGVRGMRRQAPTLRQLASLASDPWAGILRDHHDALTGLVADIEVVAHQAAEHARQGIRNVADILMAETASAEALRHVPDRRQEQSPLEGTPATKTPPLSAWRPLSFSDDVWPDDHDLTLLSTETAYQDVLTTAGKLQVPSLIAFLR